MSDVALKIRSIIAEKLAIEEVKVTRDAKFLEDLGVDSLDTVELIMELENEFGFTIPDDDAEEMKTVGVVIDYIENNAK